MNSWVALGTGALALLGLASCAGNGDSETPPASDPTIPTDPADPTAKPEPYKPGEILVRFKSGVTPTSLAAAHSKRAAQVVRQYRIPSNLQHVKLPQGMSVDQAIADYQKDPEVLYAEPNFIYHLNVTPNDPQFNGLWGMHNTGQTGGVADADINAPEAWDVTTGSPNVILGLLDTGFDYNHPDLAGNIFVNPGEIAGNGMDDDGNGWVDDVHGIDATIDSGDPFDTHGHGTHVSGTMAARGNNGVGVAGVNWDAKIVACRAFNPSGSLADIMQCMDFFLELKTRTTNPVDIVATNNSWGGGGFSQALYDAIGAHRQAGMLFVAAAGNDGSNTDSFPHYPSTYDHSNIISVLALNHSDQRASFSNFGATTVDIGAPGEDVLSTLPGNTYGEFSGTSMATPHVTGLVGLLKAQNPNRTLSQIKNLILTGGSPSPGSAGNTLTGRKMRALGSLTCTNQSLVNRFAPSGNQVITSVGSPLALGILSITCDSPTTTPQVVTVVETGATITLTDPTGSGTFQGAYTPTSVGTATLAFPNGDMVSVSAVGNYDPARIVPYELATFTGTNIPVICDDCSAAITSPFPIRFAGAEPGLTTVHVGSNGVLSFTSGITTFTNQSLPTASFQTVVAPLWDDLIPNAGSSVRWGVNGTAPNRQLIIEYGNVPHFPNTGAATFQIIFYEGLPNIRFNYADVVFGSAALDNGASATVGVQVMPGVARQFSFNTPSLSNEMSILWTMGAPLAVAGADQVVSPNAAVELDGSASTDFDGTIESYAWTQTAGTPVTLNGADTATPSFTAPGASGTLTFQLTVTDNEGNTGTDSVNVIVNLNPVAVPNPDFSVGTGLQGTLDGTASFDPDGVIVGYQWTQIHGDPVVIQNANTAIATFIAPDTAQFLVFRLTVTDEYGFTGEDVNVVNVYFNAPPSADAGQDRIVRPGSSVTLDGTGSRDTDDGIGSYAWSVTACFTAAGPCTVTLSGADSATPSFTAPDAPAIMALELTVTDVAGAVSSDSIAISVFYQAPRARISTGAGCATAGSTITLDGSGSIDPDGNIESYEWVQLSGPDVPLSGADTATASFTVPAAGTLVFQLTVTDNDGLVGTAQVSIDVNAPPIANATASATAVLAGTTVTLDGSQSTDAASYSWTQTAGTPVTLSDPSAATTTFVAVNPPGPFEIATFQLTVTDACGATSTDSVSIVIVHN